MKNYVKIINCKLWGEVYVCLENCEYRIFDFEMINWLKLCMV